MWPSYCRERWGGGSSLLIHLTKIPGPLGVSCFTIRTLKNSPLKIPGPIGLSLCPVVLGSVPQVSLQVTNNNASESLSISRLRIAIAGVSLATLGPPDQ